MVTLMAKSASRRAILDVHGLLHSPVAVQKDFWCRYNQCKRQSRAPAAMLGDLTSVLLAKRTRGLADRLQRVAGAWQCVLPAAYWPSTRVDNLEGRELRVTVNSAATKFILSRQLYGELLRDLNAQLSGFEILKIRFRVGSVHRS